MLMILSCSQIRSSPQAKAFFAATCEREGLTPLQLLRWVRTRWGSMHDLVERMLEKQSVRLPQLIVQVHVLVTDF